MIIESNAAIAKSPPHITDDEYAGRTVDESEGGC